MTYTFMVVATDNGLPETKNATEEVTIIIFSPDNHFNPVLDEEDYTVGVVTTPPYTLTLHILCTCRPQ